MAGCTSRGKLRKAGCPSKKSVIPRAQMYITDKVGRRKTKENRTIILHVFGTHTHTYISTHTHTHPCFLEDSRLRTIKEYKKIKTTIMHIFSVINKTSRLRTKFNTMKGKEQQQQQKKSRDFNDFTDRLIDLPSIETWTKMRKGL